MNTRDFIIRQVNDYISDEIDYPTMCKNIDKFLSVKPMNEYPEQVSGEHFSKTVLVYDEDLEFFDLGFYDFELEKWIVLGKYQMKLVCWNYFSIPNKNEIKKYKQFLTD